MANSFLTAVVYVNGQQIGTCLIPREPEELDSYAINDNKGNVIGQVSLDGIEDEDEEDDDCYFDDPDGDMIDGVGFADPGGNSSLRAATPTNPRNQPCGTCGRENVLTPIDVAHGYQCDSCADRLERGGY